MQPLRVFFVFRAISTSLDQHLGPAGGKLGRRKIIDAELVEFTGLRFRGTPRKLVVTNTFAHVNLLPFQIPPLTALFLSDSNNPPLFISIATNMNRTSPDAIKDYPLDLAPWLL